MLLTHQILIDLGLLLDYPDLNKGLCQGFSGVLANAVLADDEPAFYNRLKLIESHAQHLPALKNKIDEARSKVKNDESLNDEENQLLEIPAFYDAVILYLHPEQHGDFFSIPDVRQKNIDMIYSVVKPLKLDDYNATIVLNTYHAFNQKKLINYFDELSDIIKTSKKTAIFLWCSQHAVLISWCMETKCWKYINTNDFDKNTYYKTLNTRQLVKKIFGSFRNNNDLLINIRILSNDCSSTLQTLYSLFDVRYAVTAKQIVTYDLKGRGLLHLACAYGDLAIIRELLKNDADINKRDENGLSPLHAACIEGHMLVVNELLNYNPIYGSANMGVTPLISACVAGHLNIVMALINNASDSVQNNKDIAMAFSIACFKGHLSIVTELLKHISDINWADSSGVTPLQCACENGHLDVVIELLRHNVNINQVDIAGITPFFIACANNHMPIINELLKHNPDVNQATVDGYTPLHWACEKGNMAIIGLLLNMDSIQVNPLLKYQKNTPLQLFCKAPHSHDKDELLELFLKKGASIFHKNAKGKTALDIAFVNKNKSAIALFLEAGWVKNVIPETIMTQHSRRLAYHWAGIHSDNCKNWLLWHKKNDRYSLVTRFFRRKDSFEAKNSWIHDYKKGAAVNP